MSKVVVVEKIKTIREGIKIFINRFSDFDCIDSFSDYNTFKLNVANIKPEILLIDLCHKGISIIDEIYFLKRNNPKLAIIVLTMNEENELLFDALLNGASAYINKNAPSVKLIKIIEDISKGKVFVNSLIARKTVDYINSNKLIDRYHNNELLILKKVVEGNNLLAIEKSLKMTSDEIKINFHNIYVKLFEYKSKKLAKAS